jgi:DNA-binding transcriptional MocR family regulator
MSSSKVLATTYSFSRYGSSSLTPAPVSKMMADFASGFRPGVDINLGVGYVNERTIPRDGIRAAFDAVLADPSKYKVPLNYGGPAGSENLRRSIRQYYLRNRLGGVTEKELDGREIIVGASGATSLLEAIAAIFEPGVVITSDPQYYIYCEFLERMGYTVVAVPEDHSGVVLELLEKTLNDQSIRDSLRFFYFTTVSNPTSTVMSDERRQGVVALAHRVSREMERPVPVIFDKAYEELIHSDTSRYTSGMVYDQDGLVYEIGTVSKIASPALRIGYLIGSAGPLINLLIQRTSDVGFSAPLISQEIMLSF